MYKKWIAKLAVLVFSVSMATSIEGVETSPGKEIVREVEASYKKGEFDTFLRQIDEQYQSAGKAGVLRGLFESAKAAQKGQREAIAANVETYKIEKEKLDQGRNQKLLDAIAENPDLAIVKKVDSVVFNTLSTQQREVLEELGSLKYHVPDDATGTIENKISALETEYFIKSLLLDVVAHRSTVSENFEQKKIALTLEKFDRMEQATKDYRSETWAEKIEVAKEANRSERAAKADFNALKELAYGDTAPQNSVEEKVKEIMIDYLQHQMGLSAQVAQK